MTRPRLLDLFCGAGGAAVGYHRAGFDIVGIDINPQPHYPFPFIQGDALEALELLAMPDNQPGYDAIHASPPCQNYSITRHTHARQHPELVAPVRELLTATGAPWVIENVVGAPLNTTIELCGATFGLEATDDDGAPLVLKRHRLFESNVMLMQEPCRCADYRRAGVMVGGVYGAGPQNRQKASWDGYTYRRGGYTPRQHVRGELMGIDWMTQAELSQAIPPAYTEHIGAQLLAHLSGTTSTPAATM